MRLFILTSLLTFSAFAASLKEYTDCSLKSINFEKISQGEYIFNCSDGEKRFTRFNKLAEHDLIRQFTSKAATFLDGTRNLLVTPIAFSFNNEETIEGFTTPDRMRSLKKINFHKTNGQVTDAGGNVLLSVTKEQVNKSVLNKYSGLQTEFHQGDRVVIQRTRDSDYANTLSVVENCFPKNCGKTTYLLLWESVSWGKFPKTPSQEN